MNTAKLVPYEDRIVNTKDILVNDRYQRPLNRSKINRILKNFDPMLVNPPKLSLRDGRYYVFDGQHTLAALIAKNGGNDLNIKCRVYSGMTELDESHYFVKQTGESSSVCAFDRLRAQFNSGEPSVIAMVRIAERFGFIVDFKSGEIDNRIRAVETLNSVFKSIGREGLEEVLKLLRLAWNGNKDSLKREIVGGLGVFVKTYKGEYNTKELAKRLASVSPHDIIRDGRGLTTYRGNSGYAKAVLRIWNKGRTAHRLEDKL